MWRGGTAPVNREGLQATSYWAPAPWDVPKANDPPHFSEALKRRLEAERTPVSREADLPPTDGVRPSSHDIGRCPRRHEIELSHHLLPLRSP